VEEKSESEFGNLGVREQGLLLSSDPAVQSGINSCLGGGVAKIKTCLGPLTPGLLTFRTAGP